MKAIDALPRHQSATGRSGDDLSRYEVAYILRLKKLSKSKLQQRLRPIRPTICAPSLFQLRPALLDSS
jgi:hypothetical protein